MANLKLFLKSGHAPTLFAAFLYFDFSFAVWVLNGAMGPFITEQFHLSPAQVGLMVSIPTLAGALMRFPYARLYNLYLDPKEQHNYLTRKLAYVEAFQLGLRNHLGTFRTYPPKKVMGVKVADKRA